MHCELHESGTRDRMRPHVVPGRCEHTSPEKKERAHRHFFIFTSQREGVDGQTLIYKGRDSPVFSSGTEVT